MSGFAKYNFVLTDVNTGEVIDMYDWHTRQQTVDLLLKHLKRFISDMALHETLVLSLKIDKEKPLNEDILKIDF